MAEKKESEKKKAQTKKIEKPETSKTEKKVKPDQAKKKPVPVKEQKNAKVKSTKSQKKVPAKSAKPSASKTKDKSEDIVKTKPTKSKPSEQKTKQTKRTTPKTPQKKDTKELKKKDEINIDEPSHEALDRGDIPMSVVGHLDELRSRFLVTLITIIIITLGSFFISEYILDIINRPYFASGMKLNVFNLTEGFIIRLKAALIAGILIGTPVIIFQIWKYILPAIERKDRVFIRNSIIAAVFLFYGGIIFTYFLVLPFAIKMLLNFTPTEMSNTIGASKYLNFVLLFSIAMAIMFELPIVIMILTRIGILSPQLLISKRKYAIVLIWIVAAMITPPDMLTQSMLAMPIMLLYEVSIIISKYIVKRKKKRELMDSL